MANIYIAPCTASTQYNIGTIWNGFDHSHFWGAKTFFAHPYKKWFGVIFCNFNLKDIISLWSHLDHSFLHISQNNLWIPGPSLPGTIHISFRYQIFKSDFTIELLSPNLITRYGLSQADSALEFKDCSVICAKSYAPSEITS